MLVYGVYILQLKQVELQKTVKVVAPKEFIAAGVTLSKDLLEYRTIYAGAFHSTMITDLQEAIGQESLTPLGTGEPILRWKLDRFHLLPGKNQFTFQIPKEYILAISNGIRAGDRVKLYLSDSDGKSTLLFTDNITVASVKTAANREIDDESNSNLKAVANSDREQMYFSRREANGAIDQINLNLSEEEWLAIDQLCKSGTAKLVVAFTADSWANLQP